MENQTNLTIQEVQPPDQNLTNQPPVSSVTPIPEKSKTNYWMISTITLLLIIIIGGIFYFLSTNKYNSSVNQPTTEPLKTTLPISSTITSPNQVRIGGLQLTYPESWTPIFAVPNNGKNIIYFAKTEQEASLLANCVNQSSCNEYPLKLEDFANYSVWQNSTVEDFIKQVRSDIQLTNLQKTTIDGREAWLGYTDTSKTKHQTVVVTSTAQSKSFVAITASTTNPDSKMLEEYVLKLANLNVGDYKQQNAKDLSVKKGFAIEITSSLDPKESDTSLLVFILDSLLGPKNSTKSYNYLLYTASTKGSGGSVGSPSYPTTNYFNNKYYLLTDNDQLSDGVYGTSQIQIKISIPSIKNFASYLVDPKYCSQDNECQYRANFCSIGAYNSYHQYSTPWGCGMPEYENMGAQETVREKNNCQSDFDVKYDSLKCINNSCQTINPQVICK